MPLTVADIMDTDVPTVTPEDTVESVLTRAGAASASSPRPT
jgi:hypothetical protein